MWYKIVAKCVLVCILVSSFAVHAKLEAVIFDCDGVLVDTEFLKYQAWQQALQQQANIEFKLPEYYPLVGLSSLAIAKSIAKDKNLSLDLDVLIRKKNELYFATQARGVPKLVVAVNFLQELIKQKSQMQIKIGLASSAGYKEIIQNLWHINVKPGDFDSIVSGRDHLSHIHDSTGTNKPKPYIYQLIAEKMQVVPSNCIVFEDTQAGVQAASSAGMIVFAVPNKFTQNHDFNQARDIISFNDFTLDRLLQYSS